ncbi:uncharacterized protein LOC119371218 isoform X1 [Jatropha curcas]|uniref:uncharacterized protein LOC119371218 isoform X1 n=1 Tax=Jatropha curcas TaxID=180498 RepID=UPI0018957C52|nr:uncharacterized protein LOC119371218 isoform X1 [Jatropha curcas]XP_037496904.1 uncharacterized protein LOC119371218 isoform X1 [Jatropha curcas]
MVLSSGISWCLTGFYGFPERCRRQDSWDLIKTLSRRHNGPWLCVGHFNNLLADSEKIKIGGNQYPRYLLNGFKEAAVESDLCDIPAKGYKFTWLLKRFGRIITREKLDRAMANNYWSSLFQEASTTTLVSPTSDHDPLLVSTVEGAVPRRKERRFRFDNAWLHDEDLVGVVRDSWSSSMGSDIMLRKKSCIAALQSWGMDRNSRFWKKKNSLKHAIDFAREVDPFADTTGLIREWGNILAQEDARRRQLSKQFWLQHGDRNSKYFHAKIKARTRRNSINKLQNAAGQWIEKECEKQQLFVDYFTHLFTHNDTFSAHFEIGPQYNKR